MGREKSSCVLSSRAPEPRISLTAGERVPDRSQQWYQREIWGLRHCRRACSNGIDPLSWRLILFTYHLHSKPSWAIGDHSWGLALPKTANSTLDPTEISKHFSSSISPMNRGATPHLPVVNATGTLRRQEHPSSSEMVFEITFLGIFFFKFGAPKEL